MISPIRWRIADENDIVHLVKKANADEVDQYKRADLHCVCYINGKEPYIVYQPPSEKTPQVWMECGRWFWMEPPNKEKRPVTCLECLAT